MQRPGGDVSGHRCSLVMAGGHSRQKEGVASARLCPAIHVLLCCGTRKRWMPSTRPSMTATNAFPRFCTSPANRCPPACFPALLAQNKGREIGGGRATRQPGQVRKEAALTRSGSGRSSVSYLFFRANRAKVDMCPCARFVPYSASRLRETINCGLIDDRRWHSRSTS